MKNVNYNSGALKIIAELSNIVKTKEQNTPIKIVKDTEGIHVKATNGSRSIIFTVDAPTSAFDFEGDDISFYNYGEFYNYFSLFDNPTIAQGMINEGEADESEAIVLFQGNRKINYVLSSSEVIKGAIKKVTWEDPDTIFDFSVERLTQLKKVIGLLGDKTCNISFTFSGDNVDVKAKTNMSNASYEDTYELSQPVDEPFVVTISSEVFKYLLTSNYRVEVKSDGILRFFFEQNNVNASILVTAVDESEN